MNHGSKGARRANMHKDDSLTASMLKVGFEEQEKTDNLKMIFWSNIRKKRSNNSTNSPALIISLLPLGVGNMDAILCWIYVIYSNILYIRLYSL